jgi:membrane protease YdiL (CAAX protease family)
MTDPLSRSNDLAHRLRGFGPIGVFAILLILAGNFLIVPASAILVLLWARLSDTPWRAIGFVRPKSWPRTVMLGVLFGVALKFMMKAIVMPLLGAPPINEAFHWVTGNAAALPMMLYLIVVGAGFGEETIFRGWMFERLGRLFGSSVWAKSTIVVVSSVLFGLAHYSNQGIPGVEQAIIVGLVFAAIFAVTGELPLLMIAHTAFDLTALAMIYWNFETAVARFFFK